MSWFRIDDKFHTHPKVIAAGNAAVGLFVRCGAYSSDHTTDGFIPTAIARLYGTRKEIVALCTNRLWAEVEGGYRMPDYLEFNPSAEQVKAERAKATERQRKARDAASSKRTGHADVTDMSRRDEAVSHADVTVPPTRPDPTRPLALEYSDDDDPAEQSPTRRQSSSPVIDLAQQIADTAARLIADRRTDLTNRRAFIQSTSNNLRGERADEIFDLAIRGGEATALALELLNGPPPPEPHHHDPDCPHCAGTGHRLDNVNEWGEPLPGARSVPCDCTEPDQLATVTQLRGATA